MNYVPFVYLLTFKPTGQLYYGAKYANRKDDVAHPSRLGISYFTSSDDVLGKIAEYGKDSFTYEVRKTFVTAKEARAYEVRFLKKVNAAKNPKFLNKHNGDGKFYNSGPMSVETRIKMQGPKTPEHCKKLSEWQKGKPKPPRDDAYRDSISIQRNDRIFITDGLYTKNIKNNQPIPDGWYLGTAKAMNHISARIFRFVVKGIIQYTKTHKQHKKENKPKVKYVFTKEHGKNISLAKKGKKMSEEHRAAWNKSNKSIPRKWITDGTNSKRVPVETDIPFGWVNGRKGPN